MAGEKRTQDQEETLLSETMILVDIEGTTTSISFVKDTLFPYVRENLKKYIETKWENEEFKQDFEKLKEQAKKDEEDKVEGFVPIIGANAEEERESLVKNILWQMDCDRKTGALKQLQGHMWREAYNSGTVKAHVYEDVPKALESWTNDDRKVYVYSSGSVEAQKLLFGHSVHEAAAAKEAGLSTAIVIREGNAALTDEDKVTFTTIKSFLDLTFQTSTKRQKLDPTEAQENTSKSTPDVSEPMDTSEDVEMSDVSEKKVDKVETKEATQEEAKECAKDQLPKEAEVSDVKMEEPMVTDAKDASSAEKVKENASEKVEVPPSEVSTKLDTSENVQSAVSGDVKAAVTPSKNDTDKSVASEKVEKPAETTEKTVESKSETTVTASDPLDAGTYVKPIEDTSQEKNNSKVKAEKTEESTNKSEKEAKEESTEKVAVKPSITETQKSENEESSVKSAQEPAKTEEKPAENGDVSLTNVEKITAPTITEPEATSSKADANTEAKNATETVKETKSETKSESVNVKSPKAKDTEESVVPVKDTEEKQVSVEASKQELTEKPTKEETVVDEAKETNTTTVDSEKKKLNGTTQNGDTDVPVSDDKLQRNGLNEGSSNENVNSSTSESTSAQNGEPESSSEASAESIKVKKVVDSTVADGAGEPDVVPPVVVAATS
ncbi:Enolase-phosphatase E1 [Habropoda laboriosa]|uniref:Enolase-phosphatase E1 n=1 Tax=Habropoda laboriosa TaxID=597456 RepID=A0A0L7QTW1_9HYME|nr:Enolase-phosphatase E1 [Habropoda laboriosa]